MPPTSTYLHEVIRLPLSVARELGRHRGHLSLDKLTSITDSVAAELGKHTGGGLERLPGRVATHLARHRGKLHLHGICDHHLEALITHVGPLALGGVKHIHQRTARVLASQQAPRGIDGISGLYLNDVEHVTPPVAAMLAAHAGVLSLKGLRHVSPAGLEKLRSNTGINLPRHLRAGELPRHLRADATPSASEAAATPAPTRAEMIAVIERIARTGEEALATP